VNWAAAALVLGMSTSASFSGEPKVLSNLELETVTAAGVLVDVNSVAAAVGDNTRAVTDTYTSVIEKNLELGIGFTLGQALACCGENADVEVGSAVLGVGDIVHGGTRGGKLDGGILAGGLSTGFIVAVSFKDPLAMVQDLHSTLTSVHTGLAAK
jgi:hypothetical protein